MSRQLLDEKTAKFNDKYFYVSFLTLSMSYRHEACIRGIPVSHKTDSPKYPMTHNWILQYL